MSVSIHTPPAGRRNAFSVVPRADGIIPQMGTAPRGTTSVPQCPTPHLNVDEYIRLLACIEDEGGIATLDEISRALPAVSRPISAVFDLCDAGILGLDLSAGFDGDMRVWRIEG
ncbi:hypothetical protein [Lichenibacterium dinghuense]|uniref:hypothetical protein n=1 Tax=Lichenibacterium dinghuense TaxID=2895977 RepID=UPI001F170824|nr:hypothetical protein [Lichenibacterium sp. 6Y81]